MKRLILSVPLVLALAPRAAQAGAAGSQPVIPVSFYPTGAKVVYQPTVSNVAMDASWGRDAAGQPFMHVATQEQLQRRSGWMEEAIRHHGNSYLFFAVYGSTYGVLSDGRQGNSTAFVDWRASVAGIWGLPLARSQPHGILPSGTAGGTETRVLRADQDGPTVTIAAWWGDTQEVEALAIFSPDVMPLAKAKRMLVKLVRYAVRLP